MTENQTPVTSLSALLPKGSDKKAPKTTQTAYCNCGCGEATSSSKTLYKPGHDARHAGSVARDLASFWINGGEGTKHSMLDELPPKLQAKATAQAKRLVERVAEKASKAASKQTKVSPRRKKELEAGFQTEGSKRAGEVLDALAADPEALREAGLAAQVRLEEQEHAAAEAAARPEPEWDEEPTPGTVRVGRWVYPARRNQDGLVERNTKRDGSGIWEATGRPFTPAHS